MNVETIFFEECEECLAAAEAALDALAKAGAGDAELINTLFRAVHSIKGGAGAFGFEALVQFAHAYETALDLVRGGHVGLTPALASLFQRSRDLLEDHVEAARSGGEPPAASDILAALAAVGSEPAEIAPTPAGAVEPAPAPSRAAAAVRRVRMTPDARALLNGGEPLHLLRELVHLGATDVTLDTARLPALAELDPTDSYLSWTVTLPEGVSDADVREIFEFSGDEIAVEFLTGAAPGIETSAEALPPPAAEPAGLPVPASTAAADAQLAEKPATAKADGPSEAPQSRAVRVDLDRVDRVVNLVGELVITQAMLAERLGEQGRTAIEALSELGDLTRELQDGVMAMRAQPIKTVFSRMPKLIRELEESTGKKVLLETSGESTEVDKTVVERIGEPLTHMIRNAIDHGLEPPAERAARGKPEAGTVRLSAEHKGSRIVISLSDDGRGIDRARVRQKAVERGIVAADQVLTEEEIDNLIFAPGFSTAATVSNISGRGVGMDVVRKSVQALGGRVAVSTRPGQGTTISLTLPLTLAILDGMIVSVSAQTYVLPVSCIIEIIRPQPAMLKPLGAGGLMLDVRGEYVPVLGVADALGLDGGERDPTRGVLLLVESERLGRAALLVDSIRDQQQIVIKSLEQNYGPVGDVAGATILGDGRVALILDVEAMTARAAASADLPRRTGTEG